MKASVGPLTARPPTNGLTATTGAWVACRASVMPGTARIGPIEMIGFEGPMRIASAGGRPPVDPAALAGLDRRRRAVHDHELLERPPARRRAHVGADRGVAHRQHVG